MHFPYCMFRRAISLSLAILLLIIGQSFTANAQNYATNRTSSGLIGYGIIAGLLTGAAPTTDTSYASVRDTAFITDASYTNAATLTAKCFNILVVGHAGEAWVEPKFPTAMPSGSTAYFRIDLPSSSGLSVDVLATVGALTNLFTNNLITVSAYGGATDIDTGARISDAKVSKALVKDTAGNYYIAVTADSAFNAARIGLRFNTGLLGVTLGASLSMKVYYGVNYSVAPCDGRAVYTDMGTFSGLTVLALDSVVKNPVNAIDNDNTTFSKLGGSSILSVGVASTVAQSFYFKIATSDHIKLTLSTPGTVLDLGLANSIKVAAYKGDTLLTNQSLGSLLSLDLLFLLSSSSGFPVYINPGGAFDKVTVTYSHLVSASLIGNGVNIYDIRAVPPKPVLSKDTAVIYQYTAPIITATSLTGDAIKWYDQLYTDMGTGGSFPAIDTISVSALYYAQALRMPCTNLSDTAKVYIKAVPLSHVNPIVGTKGILYAGLVHSIPGSGISVAGFRYTLASGSTLPSGLTLNSNGTITGTATVTDTMAFTTLLQDTLNNLDAGRHAFNLIIRAPLVLPPMTLPVAASSVFYSTTLPPAQGGTGNYTYSLSATTPLPAGLSYDSTTGIVSGTATIGTYPILINVTDDEGRTTSQTYSLVVAAALPVYIVSFTGKLQSGAAHIAWQTANEMDIYNMQLQRSKDGASWNTIYKAIPVNNSSMYTYNDPVDDNSSVMMYRLLVMLQNGNTYYSQVLKLMIGQNTTQEDFIIYPNPVGSGGQLNFVYNGKATSLKTVQIYNSKGLLMNAVTGNLNQLTLDKLPAGAYVLKAITDEGKEIKSVLNIQ